jgi:hypothetical protein
VTSALDAALGYAARGWPVSAWATRGNRKFPLSGHGHLYATTDAAILQQTRARWPDAIPAITTGKPSGVVALDIDIRPAGSGFDSLGELGVVLHPEGPTTHTSQGGCAVLFRWPGYCVKTCSGEIGPHIDVRGDGGSIIVPPGPGRFWDPHLGPDTPLPAMPEWMRIVEPESQPISLDAAPPRPPAATIAREHGKAPSTVAGHLNTLESLLSITKRAAFLAGGGKAAKSLLGEWNGLVEISAHVGSADMGNGYQGSPPIHIDGKAIPKKIQLPDAGSADMPCRVNRSHVHQ